MLMIEKIAAGAVTKTLPYFVSAASKRQAVRKAFLAGGAGGALAGYAAGKSKKSKNKKEK